MFMHDKKYTNMIVMISINPYHLEIVFVKGETLGKLVSLVRDEIV